MRSRRWEFFWYGILIGIIIGFAIWFLSQNIKLFKFD